MLVLSKVCVVLYAAFYVTNSNIVKRQTGGDFRDGENIYCQLYTHRHNADFFNPDNSNLDFGLDSVPGLTPMDYSGPTVNMFTPSVIKDGPECIHSSEWGEISIDIDLSGATPIVRTQIKNKKENADLFFTIAVYFPERNNLERLKLISIVENQESKAIPGANWDEIRLLTIDPMHTWVMQPVRYLDHFEELKRGFTKASGHDLITVDYWPIQYPPSNPANGEYTYEYELTVFTPPATPPAHEVKCLMRQRWPDKPYNFFLADNQNIDIETVSSTSTVGTKFDLSGTESWFSASKPVGAGEECVHDSEWGLVSINVDKPQSGTGTITVRVNVLEKPTDRINLSFNLLFTGLNDLRSVTLTEISFGETILTEKQQFYDSGYYAHAYVQTAHFMFGYEPNQKWLGSAFGGDNVEMFTTITPEKWPADVTFKFSIDVVDFSLA